VPLQAVCPKCDFVVQRGTNEELPPHCPACGSRIACPRCGSTLEPAHDPTPGLHCSTCGVDLGEADTMPFASSAPTQVLETLALPGFEVRGILGRGGMGIVYRAYQVSLKRDVALKVLPPALASQPAVLDRFRREAELAARLTGSHILPVYDISEAQGVPVIVMPLIKGGDLGRVLRDRLAVKKGQPPQLLHPWAELEDRAYLDHLLPVLDQVVAGVAVLHRHGVLHRDIKPSNVLVDDEGNAWISDFGLARLQDQDSGTQTGVGMGTRGYAAPEQISGETESDARADVYGLGATLYQSLTLEMPYGKTIPQAEGPRPEPIHRRQPLLSPDFDAVVLTTLEPERERRYSSSQELQEDWKRLRQGLLPKARRAGPLRRLGRDLRRHPWATAAAVALIALMAALGLMFSRDRRIPDAIDPRIAFDGTLPLPPVGADQVVNRRVAIATEPPGANIVFVPLHELTGFPMPQGAIRPKDKTPLTGFELPSGMYLVVAEVPGYGFHEVYRVVPRPKQNLDFHARDAMPWEEMTDGTAKLRAITVPSGMATDGMAYFEGGVFTMGNGTLPAVPPHRRKVDPFYLDCTEVTVGAYRQVRAGLPAELETNPPPDAYPVSWVYFDQAAVYAEMVGKRLPDEAEYEFAATGGGTRRFPWGDSPAKITPWPLGPVGQPSYDCIRTDPPVYGLYSNVAEWTSSWYSQYPGTDQDIVNGFYAPSMQVHFNNARIIRGGPIAVAQGKPDPAGKDKSDIWDPRWRCGVTRDVAYPGLGFRCARSAKPRFLNP
jgi:formylglycine-generating enzyme required for sulfatase activity